MILEDSGGRRYCRGWHSGHSEGAGSVLRSYPDGHADAHLDGLEATTRIRALPGYLDTPILTMTANAFTEDKLRCFAAGMNDFIVKPLAPDKIFLTLLRWLEPKTL